MRIERGDKHRLPRRFGHSATDVRLFGRAGAQPLCNREVFVQLAIEHLGLREQEFLAGEYFLLQLRVLRLPVRVKPDPAEDRLFFQANDAARVAQTFSGFSLLKVCVVRVGNRQVVERRQSAGVA